MHLTNWHTRFQPRCFVFTLALTTGEGNPQDGAEHESRGSENCSQGGLCLPKIDATPCGILVLLRCRACFLQASNIQIIQHIHVACVSLHFCAYLRWCPIHLLNCVLSIFSVNCNLSSLELQSFIHRNTLKGRRLTYTQQIRITYTTTPVLGFASHRKYTGTTPFRVSLFHKGTTQVRPLEGFFASTL